jgi:hypothetical protein
MKTFCIESKKNKIHHRLQTTKDKVTWGYDSIREGAKGGFERIPHA